MGCNASRESNDNVPPPRRPPQDTPQSNIAMNNVPKRDVNRKVDEYLAWPGRDNIDPRAPYHFSTEASSIFPDPRAKAEMSDFEQRTSTMLRRGMLVVKFVRITGNGEERLSLERDL